MYVAAILFNVKMKRKRNTLTNWIYVFTYFGIANCYNRNVATSKKTFNECFSIVICFGLMTIMNYRQKINKTFHYNANISLISTDN